VLEDRDYTHDRNVGVTGIFKKSGAVRKPRRQRHDDFQAIYTNNLTHFWSGIADGVGRPGRIVAP